MARIETRLAPAVCGILLWATQSLIGQSAAPQSSASLDREIDALIASITQPKVIRWAAETPHSRGFLLRGHHVKVIIGEAMTVVAYLESVDDDPLRIMLWFVNETGKPFDVLPDRFSLAVVQPKPRPLAYVSPKQIKQRIDTEATWASVAVALSGAFSSTTTTTSGTIRVTDLSGSSAYGTYNGLSTTTDPNASAQQTVAVVSTIAANAENEKIRQLTGALLPNTVFGGQTFGGVVHFKRDRRARSLLLRLPIDDRVFEFPLEMPQ